MAGNELLQLPASDDLLEDARQWQDIISDAPEYARDDLGRHACKSLLGRSIHKNTRRVIIGAEAAIVAPALPEASDIKSLWFSAIRAKGHQGNVHYLRIGNESTLVVPLFDAEVIEHQEIDVEDVDMDAWIAGEYAPIDRQSRAPFHIPIKLIDYAIPGA